MDRSVTIFAAAWGAYEAGSAVSRRRQTANQGRAGLCRQPPKPISAQAGIAHLAQPDLRERDAMQCRSTSDNPQLPLVGVDALILP
jgi:hypothetical protein